MAVLTFSDSFSTLPLHRTWRTGDNWMLIAPGTTDGRGGPTDGESGDQWWANPFNPSTPGTSGLYTLAPGGGLRMGLMVTPPGDAAYINGQAGATMPYCGALLNSSMNIDQKYGYWQFVVSVPRIPGFTWQATIENVQLTGQFPPEIDLRITTDGSGVQTVIFDIARNPFPAIDSFTISSAQGFDASVSHTYAWDWESDFITLYIDGVQQFQAATSAADNYDSNPMFIYMLTAANYSDYVTADLGIGTVDPSPAQLPAFALVSSVNVWDSNPGGGPPPPPPPPPGTRKFEDNPGQDGTFFVCPFFTSAQWLTSGPLINILRNGSFGTPTGEVHLASNQDNSAPWYRGLGGAGYTDCTVTDGTKTITANLPIGATQEQGGSDNSIGGADATRPYLVWSIQNATISTGTVQPGCTIRGDNFTVQDGSGPYMMDAVTGNFGQNNTAGGIQDFEMALALADPNYVIQHMLCFELDASQMSSNGPIWPLLAIDNSFPNTGGLSQGYTIGIPASVPRPTGMSRGMALLWDVFQQFGGFFYNQSGNGCISIVCCNNDPAHNALAQDIASSFSAIVAHLCILSNQSGISSMKGYVTGAQYAFPPPPKLDLSPTGGNYVLPSSFGAWYGNTNYSNVLGPLVVPVPPASSTIGVATPGQQSTASGFPVTGTLGNYTAPPTLQYRDDSGTWLALPGGATVTTTTFTFQHPAMSAGTHTVSVRDANNTSIAASSGSFLVTSPTQTVIVDAVPSGALVGSQYTMRGTLSGYTVPPATLTYQDDGGVVHVLPTVGTTVTTTSFVFRHPGLSPAGSHTTVVADGQGTSGSVTYAVGTPSGSASINLTVISPGGSSITDSHGNTWTVSPGGLVCLNGIEDTTSSNVIEMAYVSNLTWYENSSSQWFSKNNATDAWNGPQTSPLGTQPILFVSPPSGISPATPFQVVGSAANYATIPVLTFADDGGAATALPAGAVVTLTSFTFTHPGMSSGPHTLVISDGTHSTSAAYSVATAGWIALPSQSGTTLTVPGLLPGTAYDFEVFASNVAGQGPFSAILTASTSPTAVVVPGAPTGLTSTAVSTTTVSLTWTAPVVGTQPLTYQAQWSPTGLNTWTSIPVVSTTSAQVTGLVAATTYDFRVSASNTAGTSPFSAIYTVATAATVPATTFNPAGASPTVTFSNQNLTATMGGSSTPYSTPQTVVGTTGQGSGKFSFQVTLNAVTQNLSVGLANASFVFGQIGGGGSDANSVAFYPSTGAGSQGALTAYFNSSPIMNPSTFGAGDTAGAVLTFLVDVTSGLFWVTSPAMVALYGAGAWNDAPASAAMNPSNGTGGLPIGVAGALFIMVDAGEGGGRVTLNAGSSAFVGPAVIPAQFPPWGGGTIVVVAPGTVTGLAGVASPNQVALTWAVPTGTPPFTYTVQYKLHSAGTYTTFGTSTSASTTVTSLVASTSYDFRVFASNGAGSGATSAVLTLSTTATLALPGQTQGVSLSGATSNSIVVSWQAPSSGGPPTSYQVQFKLSSASTFGNFLPTVTGLTETVTGLAASTSYDFRVSATNAAGTGPFSSPAVTASTTAVGNLTAAIKAWMISLAGSQVISGQKIPGATNDLSAMNNINAQTGHFPGLIGIDYWNDGAPPGAPTYSGNTGAIQWWNAGGIITLSNMTPNPQGGGAQNITAYDPNTVVAGTAINNAWNVIQDGIATGLAQLQAAGAVVIYRPFHENGAPGLWWWSEPTQAQFIALWQNHYNRLTVTHGLTNLLWLFSSGPQINYPGDSFVDFLGAEGYTNDPANSTNYGDMIAPPGHGKPIVLAEFGSGSPSFGDSSFDEQTLINALKNPSGIPLCIYFLNWSNSWSIDNMTNASGALNDPHVLNRDQLNRPTSGTLALPGQVTGLLASSPDPTDASLTWSVPSSGGAPASYQVQFKLSTVTTYTTFGSVSGTSSTVSGLSPGTTYNFRVRAVNSTGNGAFSAVATTTTQVVSGGGPGHGPAEFVPATPQVFTGRGNGTGPNWGNIRVSDSVFVDTQQGIPFGNITYTTMESNATAWAEFGRYGEIKNLYEGCTACFLADGIVLGPPDVPLDPSGFVYYTAGNYSGGAIIWRYAGDNGSMVINDFSAGRGDYINIRGDFQGAGVTVTYPGGDTHMVVNATGGLIYIYGVQYDPNTIAWD